MQVLASHLQVDQRIVQFGYLSGTSSGRISTGGQGASPVLIPWIGVAVIGPGHDHNFVLIAHGEGLIGLSRGDVNLKAD